LETYPWGKITWVGYFGDYHAILSDVPMMTADNIDPVIRNYSSYMDEFAYVAYVQQRNGHNMTVHSHIAPSYDPQNNAISKYMFAVSPSSILDSSFYTEYTNQSTALGVSTQMYTAGGSQSVGARN
jgi:hypothetical protein